jgi:hypothetical protein
VVVFFVHAARHSSNANTATNPPDAPTNIL